MDILFSNLTHINILAAIHVIMLMVYSYSVQAELEIRRKCCDWTSGL